jgi:hypothetical protein
LFVYGENQGVVVVDAVVVGRNEVTKLGTIT